ncbi:adenosylcobinamide amidohydrolase [Evansella clarkii]|uniref:adenosylcobinamide amidohydrolase n=1 Tax=Evansella clarkii TaxID=79879 RepID=UPI000995F80B|nr:adenosylcobinamide amidohydrolase [Evansella clarkii]
MLSVKNAAGGYSKDLVIKGIDLTIQKGEFFALLGPNGSGKTTLFKMINGQVPLKQGEITIEGKSVAALSKLEKAKKVAVLSQEAHVSFDYTVEEIISLGRYPHQKGVLKKLSKADRVIIDNVMEITNTKIFQKKQFRMISGGEKQRVLLAKALAQEPELLLLDEPTNHLDIKHTFHMIDLLKEWQQTKELTIFAILHDLNVASLYADRIGLLHDGKFLEVGDVNTLRKEGQLQKVYEVQVKNQSHPTIPKPQLLMTPDYKTEHEPVNFHHCYSVTQNDRLIHIQFSEPLRTISNGVAGEGLEWVTHFCNYHVDKGYDCSTPELDIRNWMAEDGIPCEQAVAMMTAVKLDDMVLMRKHEDGMNILAMVTAGTGNAVDISAKNNAALKRRTGTINTMVFVDAHFTDGALVNSYMSATEGKVKALQDLQVKDPETGTFATGTSTDSLLIGVTQKGIQTPYAGSGTAIGKAIGGIVYEATYQAVKKYLNRAGNQ